jgi:hypothetical protein
VLTNKTITDPYVLTTSARAALARLSPGLDLTTVVIKDHLNARISDIDLGDDILVRSYLPNYGDVTVKVRVLSIGESDNAPGFAVLGVQNSSAFDYNPVESVE